MACAASALPPSYDNRTTTSIKSLYFVIPTFWYSDEQEEATKLMQDAEVPLETILAQYRMLGRKLIKEEIKDGNVTIMIMCVN